MKTPNVLRSTIVNVTGSSKVQTAEMKTMLGKFNAFRDRHRIHTFATLAVLATLTFIAVETVPAVHKFVFTSGILQFVTFIVLLDLAVSVYLMQRPPATEIARNQDESMPRLLEAVPRCRTDSVDLLEYAGATTLPLIRAIRREGVPVRMLVKHLETIEGLQKQRNITALDTICNSIFENYQGSFEIRCYRLPYTLRGRRLGKELLELGWLTPDPKRQMAFGHANPSLIADLSNRNNEHLRDFFERTFETLWNDQGTENALTVLERLRAHD